MAVRLDGAAARGGGRPLNAVVEWDSHVDDTGEDDASFGPPETFYGSADDFVREFLTTT